MKIQNDQRPRYGSASIQRQYDLSQALIYMKSYGWGHVDKVAVELSDDDVAAFCRVIDKLNGN